MGLTWLTTDISSDHRTRYGRWRRAERGPALAERTAALAGPRSPRATGIPVLPPADGSAETAGECWPSWRAGRDCGRRWTSTATPSAACARSPAGRDVGGAPARGRAGPGPVGGTAADARAGGRGARRRQRRAWSRRRGRARRRRSTAWLGHRTTSHFPGPDKPLSEVHMEKVTRRAGRRTCAYPWGGEPVPLWDGPMRVWFSGPQGTVALREPGPRARGRDRGAGGARGPAGGRPGAVPRRRRAHPAGGVLADPGPPRRCPRSCCRAARTGSALALWRAGGESIRPPLRSAAGPRRRCAPG